MRASFLSAGSIAAAVMLAACGRSDEPSPIAMEPPRTEAKRSPIDAGPAVIDGGQDQDGDGSGASEGSAGPVGGFGGGPPGSGGIVVNDPAVAARSCPDPVVGVWVAKTFADRTSRWHEHRLSITRDDDGELHAIQTTRMWSGGTDQALPPVCPSGGPDWGVTTIEDDARFVDGILMVWGVRVQRAIHTCGGTPTSYALDKFTGRVRRDTYPAVNNDGSQAVNRPYHFRRVACADD